MPDQPAWEGRSRGSTWGYRFFVWLLKVAGIRSAYLFLYVVTPYYQLFVPDAIRPLRHLYRERMGYSRRDARRLIRKNLIIFGQTLIDKIAVLSGVRHGLSFTHEGDHHLEKLVTDGKGGLIISAHLGNWEVAGHLLMKLNTTVNIVMYDGEDNAVREYMDQFESRRSFNIIFVREDMSHIYEMNAALKRNELICLHADRFRPGNRTIAHEFLGKRALFPAGPFILASKLQAPVSFVFAFKETNRHYHFYAEPAKVYAGRGTSGMEIMLHDYVRLMEGKLKQYPEQWFNYFDFWADGSD